jgi:eukaryotic-like serine/threonine-protein kinase
VVVVTRTGLVLDDRYQLDEPIAAGGVGQVWRAADLLLDRTVAVKLLRPEYADHPETLGRFRAEARHAGSLTHPCIARVYDYGSAGTGTPPYLVMEFVKGPSLADMLAVDPVDPVLALDVVAQAAAGLDAAHRNGLVHRDIKPGNILLGEDGLVKITDFGIAHAAGSAPITGPGLVMGTTHYMAPERIAGAPATPASDLYSLGILIYECLTGLPPYHGGTAEVMAGHLYLPLPPLPSGVPPELDELIARLTAKDPAARLSDAAELANAARRLRDALAAGRPGASDHAAPPEDSAALAAPQHNAALAAAPEHSAALAAAGPGRPGSPGDLTAHSGQRPGPSFRAGRRRSAALAAGATVLAGAGMAWLLAAGAPHDRPAADHAPATPPAVVTPGSATAPPSTAHTTPAGPGRTSAPRASASHAGTKGAAANPGTSQSSGGSPSPAKSATQGGSASPAPRATTSSPTCLPLLPVCVG